MTMLRFLTVAGRLFATHGTASSGVSRTVRVVEAMYQ